MMRNIVEFHPSNNNNNNMDKIINTFIVYVIVLVAKIDWIIPLTLRYKYVLFLFSCNITNGFHSYFIFVGSRRFSDWYRLLWSLYGTTFFRSGLSRINEMELLETCFTKQTISNKGFFNKKLYNNKYEIVLL